MTLTDIPNHKQREIAKWLFFEQTSQALEYQIFLEYNPDYPDKTYKIIKL